MELEKQLSSFLVSREAGTQRWLQQLGSHCERLFLFGGAIRDVALMGDEARPRDLDLVVVGLNFDDLPGFLGEHIVRRTSFGGLKLKLDDSWVDLWRLEDTWAFREKLIEPSPENLPSTTFLSSQAIAAEIQGLEVKHIFESGFTSSLRRRVNIVALRKSKRLRKSTTENSCWMSKISVTKLICCLLTLRTQCQNRRQTK